MTRLAIVCLALLALVGCVRGEEPPTCEEIRATEYVVDLSPLAPVHREWAREAIAAVSTGLRTSITECHVPGCGTRIGYEAPGGPLGTTYANSIEISTDAFSTRERAIFALGHELIHLVRDDYVRPSGARHDPVPCTLMADRYCRQELAVTAHDVDWICGGAS